MGCPVSKARIRKIHFFANPYTVSISPDANSKIRCMMLGRLFFEIIWKIEFKTAKAESSQRVTSLGNFTALNWRLDFHSQLNTERYDSILYELYRNSLEMTQESCSFI